MGVMPASDIFQARMAHLFAGMGKKKPCPYIDDILHFKGATFDEHLAILDDILKLIATAGMQVSAEKSRFCQESLEYIGFQLNRTGYKPLPSRVDEILRLEPPKNVKQVRAFLGTINFIKNHIKDRAQICESITRLPKKDVTFIWDEEQKQAFQRVKAAIAESIMLEYPNPNKPFDLYPDASSTHAMRAILCQDDKAVSTFSRKFNNAQLKYTATGQELLACVEACKHFAQIIRGCEVRIHTDHKNLTHNDTQHVNLREQRARIFLDAEFAPTFHHISGVDNTGADGLSRLPMAEETPIHVAQTLFAISTLDRDDNAEFELNMRQIAIGQANNEILQQLRRNPKYESQISSVTIDGNVLTTFDGKVWVPQHLQQRIVKWYHDNLQHAGVTRMIATINQTFAWKGLQTMVEKHVETCDSCQRNKQSNKKQYSKLPLVPALRNKNPWEKVHVDCGGPWKICYTNEETGAITTFEVHILAIVDACTKWTEFVRIESASSIATAKAFDIEWLCRYPRPSECCHDNGNEFVGIEFQELFDSYGIKSKLTTVKNPQANAIVERTFGVLGDQLRLAAPSPFSRSSIMAQSRLNAALTRMSSASAASLHTFLVSDHRR